MPVIPVDDISDPRLDDYRAIRDRDLQGRAGRPGLFVGEQRLVVERMLSRPGVTKSVLLDPRRADEMAALAPAGVPVYVMPLEAMKQVAGFNIHRGLLAVGRRAAVERPDLGADLLRRSPLTLLLCEDVTNMDNIGMLFRCAAAFGVDAVLLSPRCHDPLYRKSLRVSIGHALNVPFARSGDWHADLARLRDEITLIGAATAGAVSLEDVPRPHRVGLVVGQEYRGLAPQTLALCHHAAKVPMAPGVDSLNVAVAAAVCLHRLSTGRRT